MEERERNKLILEGLRSRNARKIISAAKKLQKNYVPGFEEMIVDVLRERYYGNKSWEVQSNLIDIIGKNHIVSALPIIEDIIEKNIDFDTVTSRAGEAYLRLVRKDLSDINPIKSLFGSISYSLGAGLLNCLWKDKMTPNIDDQKILINYFWDFQVPFSREDIEICGDPRESLAKVAENWSIPEASAFLQHCTNSYSQRLQRFALSKVSDHTLVKEDLLTPPKKTFANWIVKLFQRKK